MTAVFDHLPTWGVGLGLVARFAVGTVIGAIYFQTLWWNARRLISGGGAMATLVSALSRYGLVGVALVVASRDGATALLLTTAGILAARHVVMGRLRGMSK